jgi:hypothetical protein
LRRNKVEVEVPEEFDEGLGEGELEEVTEFTVCPGFDTEVVVNVGLALPDPSEVLFNNLDVMGSCECKNRKY